MITVAGGTFQMGCDEKIDGNCEDDEKPAHRVQLTSFEMSKFEVTQEQWQAVMGSNPSRFKDCNKCPVESVSWNDVQTFLTKLNALSGKKYRLPTEAEWEYAARGGSKSRNFKYAGSNKLDEVGWYDDNSGSKTHPVGSKKSNELGLYDMSGNVWEWCSDWSGEYYLGKITPVNPQGAEKGSLRVFRGGSWYRPARYCRAALRNYAAPDFRAFNLGFRLVLAPQ
ncbi:MAG: formylglycine-generating enzyme family protein [Saprospiraceae bacterium]|nr:formylglycine-generating enzyme family protein [Saprospiraceae bacterium]